MTPASSRTARWGVQCNNLYAIAHLPPPHSVTKRRMDTTTRADENRPFYLMPLFDNESS